MNLFPFPHKTRSALTMPGVPEATKTQTSPHSPNDIPEDAVSAGTSVKGLEFSALGGFWASHGKRDTPQVQEKDALRTDLLHPWCLDRPL